MKSLIVTSSAVALTLGSAALADSAINKADVLGNYADITEAKYSDSLTTARRLQTTIEALIADPSAEVLEAAKVAWIAARVPPRFGATRS